MKPGPSQLCQAITECEPPPEGGMTLERWLYPDEATPRGSLVCTCHGLLNVGNSSLRLAIVEGDSGSSVEGRVVRVKGDSRKTRWLILPMKVHCSLA